MTVNFDYFVSDRLSYIIDVYINILYIRKLNVYICVYFYKHTRTIHK